MHNYILVFFEYTLCTKINFTDINFLWRIRLLHAILSVIEVSIWCFQHQFKSTFLDIIFQHTFPTQKYMIDTHRQHITAGYRYDTKSQLLFKSDMLKLIQSYFLLCLLKGINKDMTWRSEVSTRTTKIIKLNF